MSDSPADASKRTWIIASACTGVVGSVALAVPFVRSLAPSRATTAAGAPVEVDIAGLQPDAKLTAQWRGKPVWVVRRTEAQVAALPGLDPELADPHSLRTQYSVTPPYARNDTRSIKPEYLVVVGLCPHLGCIPGDRFHSGPQPSLPDDWKGGFLCPCHGSIFDMAGRVFKSQPSPDNMEVPRHKYVTDTRIVIGED